MSNTYHTLFTYSICSIQPIPANRGAFGSDCRQDPQDPRVGRRQVLHHHLRQGRLYKRQQQDLPGVPSPARRGREAGDGDRLQPPLPPQGGDLEAGRRPRLQGAVMLRLRQEGGQSVADRRQGLSCQSERDRAVRLRREERGGGRQAVLDVQVRRQCRGPLSG